MEERRRRIVELVNTMGNVSFAQLKERFSDVSEMTLRTDLKYLDETHQILLRLRRCKVCLFSHRKR